MPPLTHSRHARMPSSAFQTAAMTIRLARIPQSPFMQSQLKPRRSLSPQDRATSDLHPRGQPYIVRHYFLIRTRRSYCVCLAFCITNTSAQPHLPRLCLLCQCPLHSTTSILISRKLLPHDSHLLPIRSVFVGRLSSIRGLCCQMTQPAEFRTPNPLPVVSLALVPTNALNRHTCQGSCGKCWLSRKGERGWLTEVF
jgi:hypothetical protein